MNPVWGQIAGIFTVATMATFLATWAWAWLPRQAPKYDELARLPMRDAGDPP